MGAQVLYQEAASSIRTFDVEAASGQGLFAATEQECLVFIQRPVV